MMVRAGAAWCWLGGLLIAGVIAGRGAEPAGATARETAMVPMRDGVRLATDVYRPAGPGPFPVVLVRTPYGREVIGDLGTNGARRGYVVVSQDTRGRFGSEGENLPFATDGWGAAADGFDTCAWLMRQPWCNGRIGTYGGSAVGITQLLLAGSEPVGLVSQHITVGAPNLYRDCIFPGGVFKKAMIEDWLRVSKFSDAALSRWTAHPTHDAYWRERELDGRYGRVHAAGLHIGGWFDIFAQGTLDAFTGYQEHGGRGARGRQRLVMGPWTHGVFQEKAGELKFPNGKKPPGDVADTWRWFDATLKAGGLAPAAGPAVTYYVMGDVEDPQAPGNRWRQADAWPPPARTQRWFCHFDHELVPAAPRERTAGLEFTYDPANPVPTTGGPHLTLPAGPRDQRAVESRPDVLVFSSAALAEPVEVTGRVRLQLWAASDAPDTDFFARLCDVYPDGRSFNLCEGQLRARFRESFERERLLQPGRPYRFEIDLGSTSVVFNRGHRIRLQITSSSAPGYDPNPNTGEPFRAGARQRVARNTVLLEAAHPTSLWLPVVSGSAPRTVRP